MNQRFEKYPYFNAELVDIIQSNLSEYKEQFDTVICINVLEHLSDDYKAVENMKSLLQPGGKLILLVPAWQKLYCQMDKNVNHYRRYDPGRLNDIAKQNRMKSVKHQYFNMIGIILYWLKGRKALKPDESFSSHLNESNSKIYNFASVILEPIEKKIPPKVGLTEIMILQKNEVDKSRR